MRRAPAAQEVWVKTTKTWAMRDFRTPDLHGYLSGRRLRTEINDGIFQWKLIRRRTRIGTGVPGDADSDNLHLLLKADVISQDQLYEAIKLAGSKHVHTGEMLIMAGYITPRDLQAGIDAQSMLQNRRIDVHLVQLDCNTR